MRPNDIIHVYVGQSVAQKISTETLEIVDALKSKTMQYTNAVKETANRIIMLLAHL